MVEKNWFFKKNYARIGVNTDDNLRLNEPINFPTLTIIIRCILQKGEKLHPQIYLDEYLYGLINAKIRQNRCFRRNWY